MGLISAWRLATQVTAPATAPAGRSIRSPWSTGQLSQVVWADILGDGVDLPLSRADAMQVPAIAKARHLLIAHLAGLPLKAYRGDQEVTPQPTFLYRTSGISTPWHRMAWTIDDLLFNGWSLWAVERGTDGAILDAVRISPEWWEITADNLIRVQGKDVDPASVILFAGPVEGLIEYGARTIRAARNVESVWASRVRNPVPIVELHQTTDDILEDTEIDELIAAFVAARQDPNGAVMYTPQDIELKVHGDAAGSYLVEARNAVRLDVANLTGLPGEALDGSLSTASLTYTTHEGKRTELTEALRMWMEPIEARLSQDDVVPRGQRVRFDRADLLTPTPSPSGPVVED